MREEKQVQKDKREQEEKLAREDKREQNLGPRLVEPRLTRKEEKEVQKRSAVPAAVLHEAILVEGEDELLRSTSALAWSGLAAGLSMGFSLVAEGLLRSSLPDAPWAPIISKLGYSVGFLIVVLGRQQLFTENTLTPILPLLSRQNRSTLGKVARLWGVVLATNLLGAAAFAALISHSDVFGPAAKAAFHTIGTESTAGDFGTTLIRAVFAGWLIALMVWVLPGAETGKVAIIVIITYVVGLGGFAHVIAGSVEAFYAAYTGARSWEHVVFLYVTPTLIGNILGGVALVAVLNHAQVVAGQPAGERGENGRDNRKGA